MVLNNNRKKFQSASQRQAISATIADKF